jgi:transglutaminase/protease-like cytokinesis protein 3
MNFEDSVVIEIDGKKLKTIFTAVLYDNPHIFWVDNDYQYIENKASVSFTPSYRNSLAEAQQITTLLNRKVEEIVTYANTFNTDYEKELYVHNYICENTVYDELMKQSSGDSAYDSLLYGKAICEGYSRAVQILLDALDIDNYLVVGDGESNGEILPHMWNVVEIDNSNYYLDATWNDSGEDNSIVYFYFNVNDEMIKTDHFNIEPANNFCVSDSAYYYAVENSYVKSYNGFLEHSNRSADILKNGGNSVDFVFENSSDFKKALNDIKNDNGFFDYIYSAVKKSGRQLNLYKVTYYTIDNRNYLCIVYEED